MSGIRKLGDTLTFDFLTHNPATGAVTDASSTPTYEVFKDDNDTSILSGNATKRTGKTGNYRVSIAATAGNGFEVGKSYNIIVSAMVNSVSAKARIASFTLDSKRLADLNDAVPPTPAEIETYLASIHGSGSWEGSTPPTPAEIEAYLASKHGSGAWEKGAEFQV